MDGTGLKVQWSCVTMEIHTHSPSVCAGITRRPALLLQGSMSWIGMKAMKRIKHNDLTHYFLREHSTLPPAYLASCEKFFKSIKPQAPSSKPQASSMEQLDPTIDWNKLIDTLKTK